MHLDCQACGASLELEASARTATCPYCASPSVIERPPSADRPSPTFALGFTVTREAAVARVRAWIRSRGMFARSGFANAAVDALRGIYVPTYLYSALTRASYHANVGESYVTVGQGRRGVSVNEETEWHGLSGSYTAFVSDVLVAASRGLANAELEQLEPFDLRRMRRYDPAILAGWYAEDPTRSVAECAALARGEAVQALGARLHAFLPGDRHTDLDYRTWLEHESAELTLLPVWVMAVRWDRKQPLVRVLVNGQTGRLVGKAPRSWIKVTLAVLLGVLLLFGLTGGCLLAMLLAGAGLS